MPIKKNCISCEHRLVNIAQAEWANVYPCLKEECMILENLREKHKDSPLISVTKYYFDTNKLKTGNVVCIEDIKKSEQFPAILFSVDKDTVLAMRDTGEKKTTQVIIRPEDVAGGLYKITNLDWKSLL